MPKNANINVLQNVQTSRVSGCTHIQYSSFESLREFPRENSLFSPLENSPMVNQWDFPQGEFTIFPRENSPVNFRMNCTVTKGSPKVLKVSSGCLDTFIASLTFLQIKPPSVILQTNFILSSLNFNVGCTPEFTPLTV